MPVKKEKGDAHRFLSTVPSVCTLEKFLMFTVIRYSKIGKLVKGEGVVTSPKFILNKIANKYSILKQVCLAWCLRVPTAVLNLMS